MRNFAANVHLKPTNKMNKHLFALCTIGIAASAFAVDKPYIIPDAVILGFSPDNTVAVSQISSSVFFFDLESDEAPLIFSESEDGLTGYSIGNGNFVANNTILITRNIQGPSAWRWSQTRGVHNGRWSTLNSSDDNSGMGGPNGVTPDGNRICGNMATGVQFGTTEDGTMVVPCYWDYTDGSFIRTALPYSTKDYCGMAPQYVTALAISDNGKTIIGQSVSNNGFLCEYLIFSQQADGTWKCTSPFADKINPNHLTLPEYPEGEAPAVPSPETFLDEEGRAAYDAAYQAFQNGQGEEPNPADYLTPEGVAAYNAQVDISNAWVEKYNAWREVDLQILNESDSFVFNQGSISPNGKYMVGSTSVSYIDQNDNLFSVYKPVLYDIENGTEVTIPTDKSILVTGVSDLGDIIGYERNSDIDFGYALPAGATEWMPLEQYVVERNPELADWVEENWKHEVQVIVDEEEGIVEMQELYITGLPIMSRDFSLLSTIAYTFWTDGPDEYYQRYCSSIVPMGSTRSGIQAVNADVNANANAAWFDLQGRRYDAPSAPGIYIHNGSKVIVK